MHQKSFILIILLFLLTECGPDVKFTAPQPSGKQNLMAIPDLFQGTFQNMADSTILIIDKQAIFKVWKSNEQMHLDSLIKDLKLQVKKDTVISLNDGFKVEVKFTDNPSKVLVSAREKLFEISDSGIIRKYKSVCFLNYQTRDGFWLVKILKLKGEYLQFTDFIDSKEIDYVEGFTKVTVIKDTSNSSTQEYRLSPNLRQIRRILRSKEFKKEYIRLKLNGGTGVK